MTPLNYSVGFWVVAAAKMWCMPRLLLRWTVFLDLTRQSVVAQNVIPNQVDVHCGNSLYRARQFSQWSLRVSIDLNSLTCRTFTCDSSSKMQHRWNIFSYLHQHLPSKEMVLPVTIMCNQMIIEAKFPTIFNYADVTPVYNYRPITILHNLWKKFWTSFTI